MSTNTDLARLLDMIDTLIETGAYHKRRGFKLADASPIFTGNHLIEEAAELQAEVILSEALDNYNAVVEEAADTLLCLLHIIKLMRIEPAMVIAIAQSKLSDTFTTNEAEITAIKPGGTRRSRQQP